MKENDIIWVSIEESDKYELSNYGFGCKTLYN